jgi:hypothetical protein
MQCNAMQSTNSPRTAPPPPPPPPTCAVLINAEGMAFESATRLINTYRGTFPMYSDAHHGTPTAVLAGVFAALRQAGGTLGEQTFMLVRDCKRMGILWEGEGGTCI